MVSYDIISDILRDPRGLHNHALIYLITLLYFLGTSGFLACTFTNLPNCKSPRNDQ